MATKKIYRSTDDKIIGGVCGGVAEYFDVDSTLIRLALLLLFFAKGIGLLVYIIAWIIVPEKPSFDNYKENPNKSFDDNDITPKNADNKDIVNGTVEGFDKKANTSNYNNKDEQKNKRDIIGYILIALGAIFLFDNFSPFFRWERYWPLILVGVGIYLLLKGVADNE